MKAFARDPVCLKKVQTIATRVVKYITLKIIVPVLQEVLTKL